MAESQDPPRRKSGCFGTLVTLFWLLFIAGLGTGLWFIYQPQNLADVDGWETSPASASKRDLKEVIHNAIERGYSVTLSQDEINAYLARTLSVRQGGLLSQQVTLDGVRVRLESGRAEVILLRKIFGRPFTTSMYVQVVQTETADGKSHLDIVPHGDRYVKDSPLPNEGGRFGRLVVPEGFLHLVMPSFAKLGGLFSKQVGDGWEDDFHLKSIARIRIEDDRIVLDPVGPQNGLPGNF